MAETSALWPGVPVTLAPGVRRVLAPNPSAMTGPGTNSYVIGDRNRLIIDPGPDDDAHLAMLANEAGSSAQAILLTHRHSDHAAGARALAERLDLPILAWPKTEIGEHDIALDDTRPLADGQRLIAGDTHLVAWHTPGHAADHVVFHLPEAGLLLAGDTLMQAATVVILPPDGEMAAYFATLDRLAALAPRVIAPAHGETIDDAPAEIARVRAHRRAREEQILAALDATPRRPGTLVEALYPALDTRLVPVAARQVLAHLIHLASQGRAVEEAAGWRAISIL